MREKVGKSRNTVFFQWFVAPEGRKVGSLKRRGAELAGQMSDEKLHTRCGGKHISKSTCTKHLRVGPLLGSCDVETVHAVVARSTFPSENVQNTPWSDHFWKLRCRKSARRCGAKHISKWKCTKHTMYGPFLEVQMSKKVHAVVARSTFRSQNVKNSRGSGPLLEVQMSLRFASLHYTTLHYTTLHYTTLHFTTLHSTTLQLQLQLHSTTLHYTTNTTTTAQLHSTTIH